MPTNLDWINHVCICSGGNYHAHAFLDGTIRLFSALEPKRYLGELKGHVSAITKLCTTDDYLISACDDGIICVWQGLECVKVFNKHTSNITDVCVSPDNKWIASSSYDGTVRVWDLQWGQQKHVLRGHVNEVMCVMIHREYIISGSADHTIGVWNMGTGQLVCKLEKDTDVIYCLCIIDDSHFASGSKDGTIRVWNLTTFQSEYILRTGFNSVYTLRSSPSHIVSQLANHTIQVWDINSRKRAHQFIANHNCTVRLTPDAQFVVGHHGIIGNLLTGHALTDTLDAFRDDFGLRGGQSFVAVDCHNSIFVGVKNFQDIHIKEYPFADCRILLFYLLSS